MERLVPRKRKNEKNWKEKDLFETVFESPCCRTVWQSTPVYVIAVCSEKELPDRFTHTRKVPLNCLQVTPRSAQYNGQKGARQLRLMSPFAPLTCAQFTHAVGASTRMCRVPRQHVLAVVETAPAFPTTMPLHNRPVTNHGSLPRPLAVIHVSPNVECATLFCVLKTAVLHSFVENSLQTT